MSPPPASRELCCSCCCITGHVCHSFFVSLQARQAEGAPCSPATGHYTTILASPGLVSPRVDGLLLNAEMNKKEIPSINLKPPPAHPHTWFHCKNPHIAVWAHTCLTVHHSLFQTPTIICSINQPETSSFLEKGAKFGVCSARATHLCGSRDLCGGRKAAVLTAAPGRWSLW